MPLRLHLPLWTFIALGALVTTQAHAQALTVDDIRAQIEAERAAPNPYEEILSDPDPLVARRAMEIMLEQGSDEQRRIALDFGLHSPDPDLRHTALGAWLASNPRMEFVLTNGGSPEGDFSRMVSFSYGTEPNSRGEAIWITTLTGFDPGRECYTNGRYCLFRHTVNGTWINKGGRWQEVGLNDAGELAGTYRHGRGGTSANVTFRVPPP